MKTKLQSLKRKIAENPDVTVAVVTTTAFVAAYTGIVIYAIKADKALEEYQNEVAQWAVDETNSGNNVYQLAAGSFLVVPKDAEQTLVLK